MDDDKENISEILHLLGVGEFDIRVYLTILDHGTIAVTSLARELSVERATIYSALERLRHFSLAPSQEKSYSRNVTVEPPSRIMDLIENKKSILEYNSKKFSTILPGLMAEYSVKSKTLEFRVFQGKGQFLSVFEEVLRESKDEILFFGDAKSFIEYEGLEYEKNWIKRRVRKGLATRILAFESEITEDLKDIDKKELRETKFLGKECLFKTSFMVYGVKALIWNPLAEKAIVLDDPLIAEMFKYIFDFFWSK